MIVEAIDGLIPLFLIFFNFTIHWQRAVSIKFW